MGFQMTRVTSLALFPTPYNTCISKRTGGYRNGYSISYFDRKLIFMRPKALKADNFAQHYEPSIKLFCYAYIFAVMVKIT